MKSAGTEEEEEEGHEGSRDKRVAESHQSFRQRGIFTRSKAFGGGHLVFTTILPSACGGEGGGGGMKVEDGGGTTG